MKYVAFCSYGKDSLAMIIKIKELNMPLDEVVHCDIRFDDESLSGETPEMREFIPKADKILKEKFGIKVKHIKSRWTFKKHFYRIKQKGKHIGDNYGFPYVVGAWCNSRLKIEPMKKYLKKFKEPVIQYVGIAYDEPKRYERQKLKGNICPLVDLKITEKDAMEICKKYDLLSPIYQSSFRGGCWFCPKQSLSQLKWLYFNHKDLWDVLKAMEHDSHNTFKPNLSLKDLELRFEKCLQLKYNFSNVDYFISYC